MTGGYDWRQGHITFTDRRDIGKLASRPGAALVLTNVLLLLPSLESPSLHYYRHLGRPGDSAGGHPCVFSTVGGSGVRILGRLRF